jgi:ATP-dependent RNA helicase SUPV3L1/SUV3
MRGAAQAAVGPEDASRHGALAAEADGAIVLQGDGLILWSGAAAGALAGGDPFAPRVRLFGELGPEPARERARRRLEAFVAAEASLRLAPLKRLTEAVADGSLKGLARGLAYRLIEAGGLIDRAPVAGEAAALSQSERRALRSLGVRFGAFSLFMPGLLEPEARRVAEAFAALQAPHWRPPVDRPSPLPDPPPGARALAAWGLRACSAFMVPVLQLEQLDAILRAAPHEAGGALLSDQAVEPLGWRPDVLAAVLKSLGFTRARRRPEGAPALWRRRREPAPEPAAAPRPDSPFAALAALKAVPERPARRRRKRGPRARPPAA